MHSSYPSERPRRTTSNDSSEGKGGGRGNEKSKSGRGKRKGGHLTSGEDQNGHRRQRSEDKRAEVESDTLPAGTRWLGIARSDTLFEVLFQDAGLSQADVRECISKPSADRKKLVLMYYEDQWWKDVEFRKT